jgi:long-subunit acyl-CoA synthetase (AMP-forming)
MGTLLAGGIPAAFHTTSGPSSFTYLVQHTEATVVVCGTVNAAEKVERGCSGGRAPSLRAVVVLEGGAKGGAEAKVGGEGEGEEGEGGESGETKGDDGGASAASAASAVGVGAGEGAGEGAGGGAGEGGGGGAGEGREEGGTGDAAGGGSVRFQWDAFVATGAAVEDAAVEASAGAVKPGQCASIIMSSGTESNPKSVMLSHDNLTWTARSLKAQMGAVDIDTLISFLPLSSGFVQVIDIHMAVATGFQVTFARPDALRGSLATTMKEVRSGV